jgi:hypothetical protein
MLTRQQQLMTREEIVRALRLLMAGELRFTVAALGAMTNLSRETLHTAARNGRASQDLQQVLSPVLRDILSGRLTCTKAGSRHQWTIVENNRQGCGGIRNSARV